MSMLGWACCLGMSGVHRLVQVLYFDTASVYLVLRYCPPSMYAHSERSTCYDLSRRGVCVASKTCASSFNYVRKQVKQHKDIDYQEQQTRHNTRERSVKWKRASNAALHPVHICRITWASIYPFFFSPTSYRHKLLCARVTRYACAFSCCMRKKDDASVKACIWFDAVEPHRWVLVLFLLMLPPPLENGGDCCAAHGKKKKKINM